MLTLATEVYENQRDRNAVNPQTSSSSPEPSLGVTTCVSLLRLLQQIAIGL